MNSYNFSISNDLIQMVNFPSRITDCDSHRPALLCLFLASICSMMAFPPLGNSDHVVVSVSIDFPSNSQWDGLFRYPWEDIFKFGASASSSEFCEWVQVRIDVCVPHRKYQVKPHSYPWFSAACTAAIVYRNQFFHLYQKDKSSDDKVSS